MGRAGEGGTLERMVFSPPYGVVIWLWFEPFDFLHEDPRFRDMIERYGANLDLLAPA